MPSCLVRGIVAEPLPGEALAVVADPIRTAIRPGPTVPAAGLARVLAQALRPEEAGDGAPPWLLEHQRLSYRRVLAAMRYHGGALLADPVGSGKTFVALAVAMALNRRRPTVCLVPAALTTQWRATAQRLGVPVVVVSHQQASRRRLPSVTPNLVIIDESHHFRRRRTRRYGCVAPWLVGRRTLLLTATPIVNRLADLAHQLRLAVRDDTLAADGLPSLRTLLRAGVGHPALGRLVISGGMGEPPGSRPSRIRRTLDASPEETSECERLLALVTPLQLSTVEPIAALVRNSLLGAAASSPSALAAGLRRYRRLLLHARDAATAGRSMDRAELRRFTGEAEAQLVWWGLLADAGGPIELAFEDLGPLDRLIAEAARLADLDDARLARLRHLLGDGRRSLVFTARRETVQRLRQRLGGQPVAWCTGTRAGIGHTVMPRDTVLGWFGTSGARPEAAGGPCHLISTDAVAEGLDLQRVERVVHYDLPWTPMRLEQREGRAVRLGSPHAEVEVVTFTPPAPIERALGQARAIVRKAGLPAAAGLGTQGRHLWRWRAEIAERLGGDGNVGPPAAAVAAVRADTAGMLAGFALHGERAGTPARLAVSLIWIDDSGDWTESPERIEPLLVDATRLPDVAVDPERLRTALDALSGPVREHLARARGRCWQASRPDAAARGLAGRLHAMVRTASRRRDASAIAVLDAALRFVTGGHTAGEERLVMGLAGAPDDRLHQVLPSLPAPSPGWDLIEVRLLGLVLFGDGPPR